MLTCITIIIEKITHIIALLQSIINILNYLEIQTIGHQS